MGEAFQANYKEWHHFITNRRESLCLSVNLEGFLEDNGEISEGIKEPQTKQNKIDFSSITRFQ